MKRKYTITKALLSKADRSSFDRLRRQVGVVTIAMYFIVGVVTITTYFTSSSDVQNTFSPI